MSRLHVIDDSVAISLDCRTGGWRASLEQLDPGQAVAVQCDGRTFEQCLKMGFDLSLMQLYESTAAP